MASADRVAEQLNLPEGSYNNSIRCDDMNKIAYNTAIDYLKSTAAGTAALARF